MMSEEVEIVELKQEDLLPMEDEELNQLDLEHPEQFTSSELETLANIQAELDRLNKLEQIDPSQIPTLAQSDIEIDGTVDSDDFFIREETVTDTPLGHEEMIGIDEDDIEEVEEDEEEEDDSIQIETTPFEDVDFMMTTQQATTSQTKLIQITSKNVKKQPLNVTGTNLSNPAGKQYAKVVFGKSPPSQDSPRLLIKTSPPQKAIPLAHASKMGLITSPPGSHHQGLVLKSPTKIITSPSTLNVTKAQQQQQLQQQQQKVIIRPANSADQLRPLIRLPTSTSNLASLTRTSTATQQQSQQQQQKQVQQQQQKQSTQQQQQKQQQKLQQQQQQKQPQQQQPAQQQQQLQQPQIRYIRLAPAPTLKSSSPQPVALISKYTPGQTLFIPTGQAGAFLSKKPVMIPSTTIQQQKPLQVAQQQIKKIHKIVTPIKIQEAAIKPPVPIPTKATTVKIATSLKSPLTAVTTSTQRESSPASPLEAKGLRPRKPCNCTKSQCLKLYCDCFANGEFCNSCNCVDCSNNLDHEEDRQAAIKACLERNPKAFRPKIGKGKALDERRHNRGCNCKRSNCLKNYCECYEAKIPCSNICKCIGCNNIVDAIGNEKKISLHPMNIRNKNLVERPGEKKGANQSLNRPYGFIESRIIKATCTNLLTEAKKCMKKDVSTMEAEHLILENFRKCIKQVIDSANVYVSPQQTAKKGIRSQPTRRRKSLFGR